MLIVFTFVFLDAVKVKSRMFVMCVGIIFIFVTVRNIYMNTLTDINQGIVLFDYSIQGNKYNFMKRSTQRSIFLQIMLFSMNGIYTVFKDRKQELMIFATGNIYRETGTAAPLACLLRGPCFDNFAAHVSCSKICFAAHGHIVLLQSDMRGSSSSNSSSSTHSVILGSLCLLRQI